MTVKELDNIGIGFIGGKLYPRRFHIPNVGEFTLPTSYNIFDVYDLIYARGVDDGCEKGKEKLRNEIKDILKID